MKDPFKKVHLCSVGHFGGNGDKIPQWVRANGGQYSKNISQDVTHLVATKEAFKKNVDAGIASNLCQITWRDSVH